MQKKPIASRKNLSLLIQDKRLKQLGRKCLKSSFCMIAPSILEQTVPWLLIPRLLIPSHLIPNIFIPRQLIPNQFIPSLSIPKTIHPIYNKWDSSSQAGPSQVFSSVTQHIPSNRIPPLWKGMSSQVASSQPLKRQLIPNLYLKTTHPKFFWLNLSSNEYNSATWFNHSEPTTGLEPRFQCKVISRYAQD